MANQVPASLQIAPFTAIPSILRDVAHRIQKVSIDPKGYAWHTVRKSMLTLRRPLLIALQRAVEVGFAVSSSLPRVADFASSLDIPADPEVFSGGGQSSSNSTSPEVFCGSSGHTPTTDLPTMTMHKLSALSKSSFSKSSGWMAGCRIC